MIQVDSETVHTGNKPILGEFSIKTVTKHLRNCEGLLAFLDTTPQSLL